MSFQFRFIKVSFSTLFFFFTNKSKFLLPLPIIKIMSSLVNRRHTSRRPSWENTHIQALIDERRRRNYDYYYNYPGRNRRQFWQDLANSINDTCHTNYTGEQCRSKFNSLITDYNVSKLIK